MSGRPWTEVENQVLRQRYPDVPTAVLAAALKRTLTATYGQARKLGLAKSEEYMASEYACRLRRGDNIGAAYRFEKGHEPANKGLRRPGWSPGRMSATQFKKGGRSGVAVKLYKPVGTERITKDGYLERKINDDLPLQKRWRAVHIVEWEKVNGPLPPGHCIAFKDGDKTNITLENFELLTRRQLMARNTVQNLPPELVQVIQLAGALKRKINGRHRKAA